MLESVLPVYAGNAQSIISTEYLENVSTETAETEGAGSKDESTNTEENSAEDENTESEETGTETVESTETEDDVETEGDTESEEESTESEEEAEGEEESSEAEEDTESEEESTESEEETDIEESTESEEESAEGEDTETEEKADVEKSTGPEEDSEENLEPESGEEAEAVSQNDLKAAAAEASELDYILGRQMTTEEIEKQKAMVPNLVPLEPIELDTDDLYAGMNINLLTEMEESYDSRTRNIIPAKVRNQDPWGTCWAFSTLATMESSLIQQNLASKNSIDLSERHLSYFAYNTGYDALGNASLDTITPPNETYYLETGGNVMRAAVRLLNWQGAAAEEKYPYSNSYATPDIIAKQNAQDIIATAKEIYFIPTKDADVEDEKAVIKNLIKQYGCVVWSYFHDDYYYNYSTGAYCIDYCDSEKPTNHSITIVGWDDNYSKTNFYSECRPQNDGAWIVRNSWGESFGEQGYFYISYEDASLGQGNDASVVIAGEAGEYDNNYFYSNGSSLTYTYGIEKVGQVFEAKAGAQQEILKAVSFIVISANEPYEIQVYKNPEMTEGVITNPESGEAVYATPVMGETGYAGLYTVDIPDVVLQAGERFAVVVTFTDEDGVSILDDVSENIAGIEKVNNTKEGQSFYEWDGTWIDTHAYSRSLRVNALTKSIYGDTPVLSYETKHPKDFADTLKVNLKWSECIDAEKYEIYRSESIEGEYSKVGEVNSNTFKYVDELNAELWNKSVYYKIKTTFSDGAITESEPLEVSSESVIEMSQLRVAKGKKKNTLSWGMVAGADGYEIERKWYYDYEFVSLATVTDGSVLTYTDVLECDDQCEYRVRAYKNNVGTSQWSNNAYGLGVYIRTDFGQSYYNGPIERYYELSWDPVENTNMYFIDKMQVSGDGGAVESLLSWDGTTYKLIKNSYYTQVGEEYSIQIEPYYGGSTDKPNPYAPINFVWLPTPVMDVSHVYKQRKATFSWTGAGDAEFIDVYKSTDENGHGEEIWKTVDSIRENNFTDTGLRKGDIYYYWLYSGVINNAGEKVYSEPYCYRVEVVPETEKIELKLDAQTVKPGDEISFEISEFAEGEEYTYSKEVTWEAGNGSRKYELVTEGLITTVIGNDEKEILRIHDRTLEITALSADKKVILTATVGNCSDTAEVSIVVPATDAVVNVTAVNGTETDTLPEFVYLNDVITLETEYAPQNADVDEVKWIYDESAVSLTKKQDNVAEVKILKAGEIAIQTIVKSGEASFDVTTEFEAVLKPVVIKEIKPVNAKKMQILWQPVYTSETYNVYRKAENEEKYILLAENYEKNTYIDDTVDTGVNYEYKIQLVKDGVKSSLDMTEAETGRTLPDKAKVLKKTYRSLTVKNDILCEYAVSKENDKETVQYVSDGSGKDIIFNNLESEQTYYIFVRMIKDKTVYGDTIQVTLPEKGRLILSADEITLSKDEHYKVTYTTSDGGEPDEVLTWTAYDNNQEELDKELINGITYIKGDDGEEICRIVDNEIIATAQSDTKDIYLVGRDSEELEGSCKVSIYVPVSGFLLNKILINGQTAESMTELNVNDEVVISTVIQPENADDDIIHWESLDESILKVEVSEDGREVVLKALAKGICKVTAVTSNGIEKSWQIRVKDVNQILEFWIVDEENLELSDVIELMEASEGEYTYSLKEFPVDECELNFENSEIQKQLKVYGLKNKNTEEVSNSPTIEESYRLEEIQAEELVFSVADPKVAAVDADGKVTAVGAGETDIFVYGKTSKENYGSYHVMVVGDSVTDDEECSIPSNEKLSPVIAKVYLEQFSHHSNSSAVLEIKDKRGNIYEADNFTFTSADSSVCMANEEGIVRVNPTYSGTKDKTVKVTASVKNDPKKRKVTFNVVVYGKQQISNLEIFYKDNENIVTVPDFMAKQYEKGQTVTLGVKAYGSNGDVIETPAVKWSVSNSAVATIKQNKDGTATVTMKKPGQCSVTCTANDSFKTADVLLFKAVDITPILDKKTVKLETKTKAEDGYKISESFRLIGVYGSSYAEPVIETVKAGKEALDKGQFKLVKNADNSYSVAVKEAVLQTMSNNSKLTMTLSAQVTELPEGVFLPSAEFGMTVQVITKEPAVTVKEAGTINRYYNSGENVRSLLKIQTNEKVVGISVKEGQTNRFDEYFKVIKEDGEWYLELMDPDYNANSLKGELQIALDGYNPIVKTITVKTPNKKPSLKQQTTPVIYTNVGFINKKAEVVILNNKKVMTGFDMEAANGAKAEAVQEDGKLWIALKDDKSYKNNETVSVTVNIWETDEDGNRIWKSPVPLTLKAKVSLQEVKLTVKQKSVSLNKKAELEEAGTILTSNQSNVIFKDAVQWTIKSYNNATKKYDTDAEWLEVSYDENSHIVGLKLKADRNPVSEPKPASYKIRISNVVEGFENSTFDITVKVMDTQPTASVKISGKLDLTNKSACSLTGKLTFKNAISDEITAVEVVNDDKFEAKVTGKNSIALTVTDKGMPENSIEATKQNLNLEITMAGGTIINTVMEIKPVCTVPKMTLPAMKTLYKSVKNQEVKYDFGEKLAKGVNINKLEVVSLPEQFHAIVEGDILRVGMKEKEKGVKAGTYSIKVKIAFEGASGKPQTKTIKVKVVE